jgi:hypothetical protein
MVSEGKNQGLFGRHRVTISTEGVSEVSEDRQTSTTWRTVEKVAATGEHAYIYINAIAAIILPRRGFASTSDFEEFVRTARSYHDKAMGRAQ